MITCKLYGRMGNQMFQIATAIGMAVKHNTNFKSPRHTLNPSVWRKYFNHFNELLPSERISGIYKEQGHNYQQIPFQNNMCLDGYFQSEKYFDFCREQILNEFGFKWKMLGGTVSVHIRRGDYLQFPDKHPVVSMEYITSAINYLVKRKYHKYIILSDDMEWCKQNINRDKFKKCKFDYSEGRADEKDMEVMSCCEHNIIANSSFSWWGAWMNRNPNKIVIAPSVWFGEGNKHLNISDLIPNNWIKL